MLTCTSAFRFALHVLGVLTHTQTPRPSPLQRALLFARLCRVYVPSERYVISESMGEQYSAGDSVHTLYLDASASTRGDVMKPIR